MKKAKRILSVALAAALMTMPLAGCNNNGGGSSGDVIKIGGLAPLTGEVAQYGTAVDNAIKMAVEKINEEQGGILGGKKSNTSAMTKRAIPAKRSPCTSACWMKVWWP